MTKRQWRPFKHARAFTHSLNLLNQTDWQNYCKSRKKPRDIPAYPQYTYYDQWISWPDFLGYIYPKQKSTVSSFAKQKSTLPSFTTPRKRKPGPIPTFDDPGEIFVPTRQQQSH